MMIAEQFTVEIQATLSPTGSLIMPFVGKLISSFLDETVVTKDGQRLNLCKAVVDARKVVYDDLCSRYYETPHACQVEDFVVTTYLDPRFKLWDFPHAHRCVLFTTTCKIRLLVQAYGL
jgi:hypothetical protein